MRRLAAAVALLAALAGCGGSSGGSDSPTVATTATAPAAVTAAEFRAAVTDLWQPLKYADATKLSASALAAKFDGFAAAVEAQPAPSDEISARAAIASAARAAAADLRASSDPVAVGGALGAAQGTIGGLIQELPK